MKLLAKSAVLLAIIAALLSFAKFDHCRNFGWGAPEADIHACYSDFPALLSDRGLTTHTWPYASATNAVEYPPIIGLVMWGTSFAVKHNFEEYRAYFDVNAFLIALLFIFVVVLLKRMKPDLWYLLPVAPAVIASLYINWDMWAVISAVLSIFYFDQKIYGKSAIALGVSIATKFFPIVLLFPIALIFFRSRKMRELSKYFLITLATWLVINLPFMLSTPTGWFRFFKMNSSRGADWGSFWHALSVFGVEVTNLNLMTILVFLLGLALYSRYFFGLNTVPTLGASAFIVVAIFVTASKVYSPQYILWLTPLAVLAMGDLKDRSDFWVWQGAEFIYHLAIWEYLASYSGAHFGLPAGAYATAALLRILTLTWFVVRLARRSTPKIAAQNLEFLTSASGG